MKGKTYADEKRRAKISDVKEGDRVLLKRQKKPNKLASFEPEIHEVIERKGSEVTVKSSTGSTYRHNIAHTTKVEEMTVRTQTYF